MKQFVYSGSSVSFIYMPLSFVNIDHMVGYVNLTYFPKRAYLLDIMFVNIFSIFYKHDRKFLKMYDSLVKNICVKVTLSNFDRDP